ncbi:MAG: hypothetical protein R3F61_23435 [Myxococcota bacterium]
MRAACALGVVLALSTPSAADAQCPVDALGSPDVSPALAGLPAEARLAYLREHLPRERRNAQRWFLGWTTGFSVLTVGQLAAIPVLDDRRQTPVLVVNSASTALGAGFLLVAPPRTVGNVRRLEALEASGGEPCEVLAEAERLLVRAASAERFGKGWLTHAGNVLLNVGAGAVLGLAFDDWESAWLTTAAGMLVGEVMIWTQPMDASRDLARYRSGAWAPARAGSRGLRVFPWVRDGGGLIVMKRF